MMSPHRTLIVNENPLILSPTLAAEIGLNEALFLQQLHYWLGQSSHVHDGHTWVYNTKEQWGEQFPFWSSSTLKRTISNLRKQGLIHTTDQYNPSRTDRKLWYTINYERLPATSGQPPATSHQSPTTSDQSPIQNEPLQESDQDSSRDQDDSSDGTNIAPSSERDDTLQRSDVDGSLYGTETTHRDYDRDYSENTTTTQLDRVSEEAEEKADPPEEPVVVAPETTSNQPPTTSNQPPTTNNQPPTTNNQLQSHGLSQPITLALAQQYPEEYLQEKIAFLEYELERSSGLSNPAGWLRCAIEQDYAAPLGYHAVQEAAAKAAEWQAITEKQTRQTIESVSELAELKAEAEATRLAQEAERIIQEAARFYPLHGTTETLIQAWEEGYKSMVQTMSLGSLLETLEQSVLLSFANGHAKIGVKCQYALQRLQQRGKHALRNALNFALGDTLQGQRASYELVLV